MDGNSRVIRHPVSTECPVVSGKGRQAKGRQKRMLFEVILTPRGAQLWRDRRRRGAAGNRCHGGGTRALGAGRAMPQCSGWDARGARDV